MNVDVPDPTFFVVCWFYVEDNYKHFIGISKVTYYMTSFSAIFWQFCK